MRCDIDALFRVLGGSRIETRYWGVSRAQKKSNFWQNQDRASERDFVTSGACFVTPDVLKAQAEGSLLFMQDVTDCM